MTPWIARSSTSCSAEVAKPISPITSAPPKVARSNMILRPWRSASAPQIGPAIIIVKAWEEMTNPESNSVLRPKELPRCSTYSGRKGKMIEKPIAEASWARKTIARVRCQPWRWRSFFNR